MSKKNTALKAGLGYTIGNILVKGINFLVLPIFSRLLTTEEFGVYNVFLSYDAILSVLLGLALHSSVKSAHYEFKKTDEYVSSISLIYIINAIIYFIIALIGGDWLADRMGFSRFIMMLLIPFGFGGAILQLYNERISLDYSYKKYLVIAFANSIGNVVISLVLILTVYRTQRDVGRIIGTVGTLFVISVMLLWKIYEKAVPKYNKGFWKFGLLYSLPIVPHGISQVILSQCDRIMILNMVSKSASGIYSLAGNLKLILTVISSSIAVSWSTWFFSKMDKGELNDIQRNSALLVRMFLIFTVGLMALAPEIIYLLGGKEYDPGKFVAVPMIMDAFILFLYNIIIPSEYYMKKTKYIMTGTLIAAFINLITNYYFIKRFGFVAAAYTTLFSYVCYLLLHLVISKRLVRFEVVEWKFMTAAAMIMTVCGVLDLVFVESIALRYSICLAVVLMLCLPLLHDYVLSKNPADEGEHE